MQYILNKSMALATNRKDTGQDFIEPDRANWSPHQHLPTISMAGHKTDFNSIGRPQAEAPRTIQVLAARLLISLSTASL